MLCFGSSKPNNAPFCPLDWLLINRPTLLETKDADRLSGGFCKSTTLSTVKTGYKNTLYKNKLDIRIKNFSPIFLLGIIRIILY